MLSIQLVAAVIGINAIVIIKPKGKQLVAKVSLYFFQTNFMSRILKFSRFDYMYYNITMKTLLLRTLLYSPRQINFGKR